MQDSHFSSGTRVELECTDGALHAGVLLRMPFYDKSADIPRGRVLADW